MDYMATKRNTLSVNILIISFMTGIILNGFLLLLSVVRIIKFLTSSKALRVFLYCVLGPTCLFYINLCFWMMANYWGATAYEFNACIGSQDCLQNENNNIDAEEFYFLLDYFWENKRAVYWLRLSYMVFVYTPFIMAAILSAILFALSVNFTSIRFK